MEATHAARSAADPETAVGSTFVLHHGGGSDIVVTARSAAVAIASHYGVTSTQLLPGAKLSGCGCEDHGQRVYCRPTVIQKTEGSVDGCSMKVWHQDANGLPAITTAVSRPDRYSVAAGLTAGRHANRWKANSLG